VGMVSPEGRIKKVAVDLSPGQGPPPYLRLGFLGQRVLYSGKVRLVAVGTATKGSTFPSSRL
jgi:hypothetical protein